MSAEAVEELVKFTEEFMQINSFNASSCAFETAISCRCNNNAGPVIVFFDLACYYPANSFMNIIANKHNEIFVTFYHFDAVSVSLILFMFTQSVALLEDFCLFNGSCFILCHKQSDRFLCASHSSYRIYVRCNTEGNIF